MAYLYSMFSREIGVSLHISDSGDAFTDRVEIGDDLLELISELLYSY